MVSIIKVTRYLCDNQSGYCPFKSNFAHITRAVSLCLLRVGRRWQPVSYMCISLLMYISVMLGARIDAYSSSCVKCYTTRFGLYGQQSALNAILVRTPSKCICAALCHSGVLLRRLHAYKCQIRRNTVWSYLFASGGLKAAWPFSVCKVSFLVCRYLLNGISFLCTR